MHENIQNIISDLSISEIANLETILNNIKIQKKIELESSSTLFKFVGEYEIYIKNNLSLKYFKSVKLSFKHLIEYFGENKLLVEITVKDAENFKQNLIQIVPRGYPVYLRTIKAGFSMAKEWEYISKNPFSRIKYRKQQEIRPLFIEKERLDKILYKTTNEMIRNIFIFGFNTGCRLGEIVNMRWQNIDLNSKTIQVGDNDFTTKSRKQRIIPMNLAIFVLLKKLKGNIHNPKLHVFCKDGGFPYNREYVSRRFKIACRAAGLPEEIHFHTLRHSFASNLAMKGVSIVTIKELLGHSSIITTQIYSHANFESLKSAVDTLNIN